MRGKERRTGHISVFTFARGVKQEEEEEEITSFQPHQAD